MTAGPKQFNDAGISKSSETYGKIIIITLLGHFQGLLKASMPAHLRMAKCVLSAFQGSENHGT